MIAAITGATGGLGTSLARHLADRGLTLRALVRPTSEVQDLHRLGAELVRGEITDASAVAGLIDGADVCYHVAAQVSGTDPGAFARVNVEGTRTVCEAIRRFNPRCRLVHCSSIAALQTHALMGRFASDYARSKHEADRIVTAHAAGGRPATIIYPGYIIGTHDRHFLPGVLKLLERGLPFLVRGGERDAPVVYVDDLCELFRLAGVHETAVGKRYAAQRRSEIGMHDILRLIAARTSHAVPTLVLPRAPLVVAALALKHLHCAMGDAPPLALNARVIGVLSNRARHFHDAAARDLGWDHRVSIEEGLERALASRGSPGAARAPNGRAERASARR